MFDRDLAVAPRPQAAWFRTESAPAAPAFITRHQRGATPARCLLAQCLVHCATRHAMPLADLAPLLALLFCAALLYSSVGHAGASAYLAVMALMSVAPLVMKPTALALNLCVASFVVLRYGRAGLISPRIALACLAGSIPMAFIGGGWSLPGNIYKPLLGSMLLLAALRLAWPSTERADDQALRPVQLPLAMLMGALIGLLSGLTGTGGGIFLSPLLIFLRWTEVRKTLGTAALFILCNSAAGLAGNLASVGQLPAELPWMIVTVMLGAWCGTWLGLAHLQISGLRRVLAAVLTIAGLKLAVLS